MIPVRDHSLFCEYARTWARTFPYRRWPRRRPQTEACCRRRDPRRTHLTGTFNLFVKDRIAFRLSGALSGQARLTQGESRCPRNLLKLQSPPYNCQP